MVKVWKDKNRGENKKIIENPARSALTRVTPKRLCGEHQGPGQSPGRNNQIKMKTCNISEELKRNPAFYRVKLSCKISRDCISGETPPPAGLGRIDWVMFNLCHAIEDIVNGLQKEFEGIAPQKTEAKLKTKKIPAKKIPAGTFNKKQPCKKPTKKSKP